MFRLFGGARVAVCGIAVGLGVSAFATGSFAMAEKSPILDPAEYKPFKLVQVEYISPNTNRYRFNLPDGACLGLETASLVMVQAVIDGEEVARPYTPTTLGDEKGHFDLVVKTYPTGKMSQHLYNMKVGQDVLVKGPYKKIPVTANFKKELGMVAGGTGITPMYQVIQELLRDETDRTQINLIFGNVTEDDILLKDELDNLAAQHPRFKVFYVLDKAPKGWTGGSGYITKDMLKQRMPAATEDSMVMVCGPPPMVKAISGPKNKSKQGELKGLLKDLGYTEDNVFKF